MGLETTDDRGPEVQGLLEHLLDDQRASWDRGERTPVETFLERAPSLRDDADAILDLICHECLLRRERGERPDPQEFLERFPHLGEPILLQLGVDAAISTTMRLPADRRPPGQDIDRMPARIGDYEVIGVLGRGGMGVVYRAFDPRLGRPVALKTMTAAEAANPASFERFRAEAQAVARLQHPNIIAIHAIGEHEDRPYLSLELAEGGSLARRLAENPMGPREAAELLEILARAVHTAHQAGIVHRDLKPGNVLLTADGIPKLADFGLARLMDSGAGRTLSGQVVGTPSYMAPEQAQDSRKAGPPADIYALGAILYQALTGRPPFLGDSALETIRLAATTEAVPPRRLRPDLPRDLETICLKCLEKEPARRYPDTQALADDLRRYLDGRPIAARPIGPVGRAWRWSRRNPWVAGLSAAVLLILLAATIISSALAVRATRAEAATREQSRRAEQARRRAIVAINSIVLTDRDAMLSEELRPYREGLIDVGESLAGELFAETGPDPQSRRLRAQVLMARAKLLYEKGDHDRAQAVGREAVAILEALVARPAPDPDDRSGLAHLLHQLQSMTTDPTLSRSLALRSNEIHRALLGEYPGSEHQDEWIGIMAQNLHNIGNSYFEEQWRTPVAGRKELVRKAIAAFLEGEQLSDRRLKAGTAGTDRLMASLAYNEKYLCRAQRTMAAYSDDPAERSRFVREAVASGKLAVARFRSALDRDPNAFLLGLELHLAQRELGEIYREPAQGNDSASAIAHYQAARETLKAMAERHRKLVSRTAKILEALVLLDFNMSMAYDGADLLRYFDGPRRAACAEMYDVADKLCFVTSPSRDVRKILAHSCREMADYRTLDGEPPDLVLPARAEQLWDQMHREDPDNVEAAGMLVLARRAMADALRDLGRTDEASGWLRRAPESARGRPELSYDLADNYAMNADYIGKLPGRIGPDRREDLRRRNVEHGVAVLREAITDGFRDVDRLRYAPRLAPLRVDPGFQDLIRDLQFPADPFLAPQPR